MQKKYKLTDKSIRINDKELYRIRAIMSFGNVSEGDLGGYVENESNLEHFGNAWVYGNSIVDGKATNSLEEIE